MIEQNLVALDSGDGGQIDDRKYRKVLLHEVVAAYKDSAIVAADDDVRGVNDDASGERFVNEA